MLLRRARTVLFVVAGVALAGCAPGEPASTGGAPTMRRLSESQYRQVIAASFGERITVAGRFEPELRQDGLLAVGSAHVTVTRAGLEHFDALARDIARQVVAEANRGDLACQPAAAAAPDSACAAAILGKASTTLFRRPLAGPKLDSWVAAADGVAARTRDFYAGLQYALGSMLMAPDFLFRADFTEPDPAQPGAQRLDAWSKAQRLSFLLWDGGPDEALMAAAAAGELDGREGVARQVDRMLASPRLNDGVRAFFVDFLAFDGFGVLEKDPLIYPKFSQRLAADAREQTLRVVTDHLVARKADYRDLFITPHSFMTRRLGAVYAVPVKSPDGWDAYDFAKDDPRAGLLAQVSFSLLHSHAGRSSATLRGKAIRELLLCQPVPAPPNNVNFAMVQDTSNPDYKTARDRLTAHRTDPTCAGCHKVIDPIGLALENFDGLGEFRSTENGAPIDGSGEVDGRSFEDVTGLAHAMRDNSAVPACLVTSLYRYAVGRNATPGEAAWLGWLQDGFARDGYRVPDLLRRIATSPGFFAVIPEASAPTKEARS